MPKYDSGKPQFSLIDPKFMLEFAQVMTMGAEKYGADNWKTIENAIPRYKDALHRHMNAFEQGKMDDEESGLSHLAHVAANAMFLHWLAHNPQNDSAKSVEMGCKNCAYNALSNNLVTNSKCVACTYYKNNGKGDNNFVVKDCAGSYDRAVEQLVIKCCDTCKWSSRPKGYTCKTCNYGNNYVADPRFHCLLIYNPVHRSIEGDDNAEAVRSESASNMVDPAACECGCPGRPANDEEGPRGQGESESLVVILGLG
jgi:hypothetical protein